jgi:hypothetical protein
MTLKPVQPAIFVLAAALCCFAQDRNAPVKKNYADEKARGATKTSPLIDHSGAVLPASKTYAIYWGNTGGFPSDLQFGMVSLLSGFNRSSYLGIAEQYMRGAATSTA